MRTYLPGKVRIKTRYLPHRHYKKFVRPLKVFFSSSHSSATYQPKFSYQQVLLSFMGSFLGIGALAYLCQASHSPLIAAPLGATAVLVYGVPDSPFAQPRNVIGGNFLSAAIALIVLHLFGPQPWVMALAVALSVKAMQLTRTVHPPGGAVALLGVLTNAGWEYAFTPILAGSAIIVLVTVAFSNLAPGRHYPKHWL